MIAKRNRWMAALVAATMLLGTAVAFAEEPAAEAEEDDDAVPAGASYSLEATGSYHHVDKPWFTTGSYHWFEGFARARGFYGFANGAHLTVGGVVTGTMDEDYYGTKDEQDGLLDQLALVVPNVGESGFGFTIGRQALSLGDGFLVGDGYLDSRAALWNIPISFYDGVSAHLTRGPHRVTAAVTDFSPSFAAGVKTDGLIMAGEYAWLPSEGNELALTFVRADVEFDGASNTPYALSVRGKRAMGPWSAGSEIVFEGGDWDGTTSAGKGGHAEVAWAGEGRFEPTVKVQGFWFSGDDPATADEDESYFPWQFTWNDWSNWYVGDLLASTVGTSSNQMIGLVEFGMTPRKGTGLRLLLHRFTLVEGDVKPFAYEVDVVVEQELGERLSGYVMGAWAKPLEAAEVSYGTEFPTQVFAALTWKFSGKLAQ